MSSQQIYSQSDTKNNHQQTMSEGDNTINNNNNNNGRLSKSNKSDSRTMKDNNHNRDKDNDSNNVPIMEESNQTEEERRQIRRQQRDLYKDLENHDDQILVEDFRDRNNEIYKNVHYAREAVLDGDNLTLIATKAVRQGERMIQAPRYDAAKFVRKLVQKGRLPSGNSFDWVGLGLEAGICFNGVPSGVCFLNGPLADGKPLHVRQRPQHHINRRQVNEEKEAIEERPEDIKGHTKRNADSLCSSQVSMMELEKTLKRKVDDHYREAKRHLSKEFGGEGNIPQPILKKLKKVGAEIAGVQFLFNPNSFTQTVENLFHFAFCIKKGSASITMRKGSEFNAAGLNNVGGPNIKYVKDRDNTPIPRQAIVSLSMKDWRKMCEAYEVTKGDLPHRAGSKPQKQLQHVASFGKKKPPPYASAASLPFASSPSQLSHHHHEDSKKKWPAVTTASQKLSQEELDRKRPASSQGSRDEGSSQKKRTV